MAIQTESGTKNEFSTEAFERPEVARRRAATLHGARQLQEEVLAASSDFDAKTTALHYGNGAVRFPTPRRLSGRSLMGLEATATAAFEPAFGFAGGRSGTEADTMLQE